MANVLMPPCPHCGSPLKPFELPSEAGWDGTFHLACFNDECPYYVRGWDWMEQRYGVRASYRFRVDPNTGTASPIAVWSPTALRDRIIEDDVVAAAPGDDVAPDDTSGAGGKC